MTSDVAGWPQEAGGGLKPGSRIACYQIEERIATGGMAVVYRARDVTLQRLAAVKVIAPTTANDPEFRARFLRESRAAAAVDSLHILPVYGAGEKEGLLYIATRLVAGGDLVALLHRAGGWLAPALAVSLVTQVASALDTAHAVGLVHRDVKPQNILVDGFTESPEHAYLCDFGLSKGTHAPTKLTMTGQFVGTPAYSSPEQIRNLPVDGRTDQYALACVAFVLLTGTLPFDRGDVMATLFAQVNDPAPLVTDLRPGLPKTVDEVIARAMAKSPDKRYDSCAAFAKALLEAVTPALWVGAFIPRRRSTGEERSSALAVRPTGRPGGDRPARPPLELAQRSLLAPPAQWLPIAEAARRALLAQTTQPPRTAYNGAVPPWQQAGQAEITVTSGDKAALLGADTVTPANAVNPAKSGT